VQIARAQHLEVVGAVQPAKEAAQREAPQLAGTERPCDVRGETAPFRAVITGIERRHLVRIEADE
jgi:hypothetical protein